MHIPENYLSPATCAVMTAAMVPVWGHAVKKVKEKLPTEKLPLMGVAAAFCFLGMMFNVPLPGGTTGHAVGGTLAAILLGPDAACLSLSIALLIQAVLFGDGGILSFGANCFNMAFVLPYLGYGIFLLISTLLKGRKGRLVGAAIGSYIGINAAAFCTALELGLQPLLFTDSEGLALYCPYGWSVTIPAMMIGNLTLFGLAEVFFTVFIYLYLEKTSPQLLGEQDSKQVKSAFILLGILIAAVPVGLLAQGTAWGEWAAEEIADVAAGGSVLGYTPSGLLNGFSLNALLPDYSVSGLPEWIGYILSAVIGAAISVLIFRLVYSFGRKNEAVHG